MVRVMYRIMVLKNQKPMVVAIIIPKFDSLSTKFLAVPIYVIFKPG